MDMELLMKSPIFSGVAEEDINSMLDCLQSKNSFYRKNSFIFNSGDRTDNVGLMLSGEVLVVQEDFWGNRNIMTAISAGQIFAESFACTGAKLNVSVQAASDCSILWLNVNSIMHTCKSACPHHNRIIMNLLSDLAGKNLRFNEKLTHMGQRTTREKLLSYLSAESQKKGASEFDIPFSRQELADYLSVERSAMSTALGNLRDDGLIEYNKSHFLLINSEN